MKNPDEELVIYQCIYCGHVRSTRYHERSDKDGHHHYVVDSNKNIESGGLRNEMLPTRRINRRSKIIFGE